MIVVMKINRTMKSNYQLFRGVVTTGFITVYLTTPFPHQPFQHYTSFCVIEAMGFFLNGAQFAEFSELREFTEA